MNAHSKIHTAIKEMVIMKRNESFDGVNENIIIFLLIFPSLKVFII